ncbi:MAG: fibronectin type III domain-containing protein, partial [Deltaproteobacteria bacterium]|nr:fibronectin type III domain-containing protein [Deltaproteobacteria bacterium]
MPGRKSFYVAAFFIVCLLIPAVASAEREVKISIFNFDTVNIEAAGYGTTVSNMLATSLKSTTDFDIIDRKNLEAFLMLNDLQQNDDLKNVVNIGNRLGLYAVVTGSVEKKGAIITITCKVIQIDKKNIIFRTTARSVGDAGLVNETNKLSTKIKDILTKSSSASAEDEAGGRSSGPTDVKARAGGSNKIFLTWNSPPDQKDTGYKIFRSRSEKGPFAKIAQVETTEYRDEYLDTETTYYYKIRSYDSRGRQSGFSDIASAATAPTPNPPIILKTVPHVKAIEVVWAPSPARSADPNPMKGYKLYRAKVESGPYSPVATILGRDVGLGGSSTTTLDKLLKVEYIDKNLADGEDYYYKVSAYDVKDLESDLSAPIKGSTIPVVRNLSVRDDMIREIELTWDHIPSPLIKGYYVYRGTQESGEFSKIKKVDRSSTDKSPTMRYTDEQGLGDNVTYYYKVTAYNGDNKETSPSVPASATTKGKPPVVKDLKATGGQVKQVTLEWKGNSQEEVRGYVVYRSGETYGTYTRIDKISGREKKNFVDKKLDDNGTYCYRITTYNKVDVESEMTDAVCATTKPRPSKPTGLSGQNLQVKKVPLRWSANAEKDI